MTTTIEPNWSELYRNADPNSTKTPCGHGWGGYCNKCFDVVYNEDNPWHEPVEYEKEDECSK